jgi:DNA-directed RNA polymerase I subunit RPA1
MNAPTAGGLHDKALGVSPFDNLSTCETCGLPQTKCPGHCGHIELTAPIYNPFLFKDAYRLLKTKCFNPECNKIRIHPDKVKALVSGLKLLKAGHLVASGQLKNYQMNASKNVNIIDSSVLIDANKLKEWKKECEILLKGKAKKSKGKEDHLETQAEFSKLQAHF